MSLRKIIKARLTTTNTWYEEVPGSDWVKVKCMNPDHNDSSPSAGINVDSGIHHCFSCLHNFMFIEQDEDADDADVIWKARYANIKKNVQHDYPDFDTVVETQMERNKEIFLPPIDHAIIEEWRGLSAELLEDCKAYYCSRGKYRGRYVFPFYSDGKLLGCDARIVDASANIVGAKWYRSRGTDVKALVYPRDVLEKRFKNLEHIVIAEGVADALSYIQMGVPAIASFGVTPPGPGRIEELLRMGVTKVTLAFDNDAAGITGMLKVLPLYQEWFEIISHPMVNMVNASEFKDANDFLVGIKKNGLQKKEGGYDDDGGDV